MRLIILFLIIVNMTIIMFKVYKGSDITLEQALILATDMFIIIAISTKLV